MTTLEHTLIALGICVGSLFILFSQWAKLDARRHNPWERRAYLIRSLDTIEWFMAGRHNPPLSDKETARFNAMTRFMARILKL